MKATENFKKTIKEYLDGRAKEDTLFAVSYAKEKKTIDDCITYILNAVQKSGCNGFSDEEIFGMAVHYYDEDNIDVGNPIDCKVVVNHEIVLTEEEKAQARKDAIQKYHDDVIYSMRNKNAKPKTKPAEESKVVQASLF